MKRIDCSQLLVAMLLLPPATPENAAPAVAIGDAGDTADAGGTTRDRNDESCDQGRVPAAGR